MLANRLVLAALVVLALVGLYGAAGLSRPMALASKTRGGPVGALPVTSALVACPAPGSGGLTGGDVAEASAPTGTGSGRVVLTRLGGASPAGSSAAGPVSTTPQPGQLTVRTIKTVSALPAKQSTLPTMAGGKVPTSDGRGGLVLAANGADAQGFDAEQLSPAGIPTARCEAPGSDFWFVGPGSTTLHTELYLMNTDSQPADADVSIQTDSGALLGAADSGIVVPPHGMVVQTLDALLHGARAVALHVTTSAGRVVAAVRESTSATKPGIWLPVAAEPATRLVLPGMPGIAGTRELYLTVPGGGSARVKVTAVTAHGSYQPTGGNGLSLLPHQSAGEPIPSLSGSPGSIVVSSNVPVTAELEVTGGPPGAPGAMITGSAAIVGQSVIAASPVGKAGTTELVLSAPWRAANVRISQAVPGTALTGQQGRVVHIPAKSSYEVKVLLPKHTPKTTLVAILVTPLPGSGPVYAARLADVGNTVQTVLPFISTPTTVVLPSVRSSLVAVLGS